MRRNCMANSLKRTVEGQLGPNLPANRNWCSKTWLRSPFKKHPFSRFSLKKWSSKYIKSQSKKWCPVRSKHRKISSQRHLASHQHLLQARNHSKCCIRKTTSSSTQWCTTSMITSWLTTIRISISMTRPVAKVPAQSTNKLWPSSIWTIVIW